MAQKAATPPPAKTTPGTDFQNGVRFLLYETVDGQNILRDSESIPLLKDGIDGLGSFVMDLTNEMSSVNVDVNNHPTTTGQNVAYWCEDILWHNAHHRCNFILTDNSGNTRGQHLFYCGNALQADKRCHYRVFLASHHDGKKEITIQATFTYDNQQHVWKRC